jgi:cytochrome c-type biogenesis protein CcmH/NrfF
VARDDRDDGGDEFFVDRWVDRVNADPVLRGRILKWFWLTSLAMLLLGLAFILLIYLGRSPF